MAFSRARYLSRLLGGSADLATAMRSVDGTGSEVDADKLDGEQGSYYLAYSNFTGTPTIPSDPAIEDSSGSPVLASGITAAEVRTLIGAGTSSFDGAYGSLTGTPTIPSATSDLTNDSGFITSADGGNAATLDSLDSTQFLRSDAADTAVKLTFGTSNVQAPTSSDATTGARLILYPLGSGRDYSIGIESNTMWFNSDDNYKWYADGSLKFEWDNTAGQFEIGGNVTATRFRSSNGTITPYSGITFSNVFTAEDTANRVAYFDSDGGSSCSVWWGSGSNAHAALDSTDGQMDVWVNPSNNVWSNIARFTTSGMSLITGSLSVGSNTVWHAGNDGSGSGLDADLLDGQHSTAFLRTNGSNTGTYIDLYRDVSSGLGAYIDFREGSAQDIRLGVNVFDGELPQAGTALVLDRINGGSGDGHLVVHGEIFAAHGGTPSSGSKVWHAGNDGSGSGLDADTLDGYQLDGSTSIATRIFNNKGQTHGTVTNFNTAMTPGPNYIQANTNGPGVTNDQWYGFMFGLGTDYGTTTGSSGHYAAQMYFKRNASSNANYLYMRSMESGSWGSWLKVTAGYADSAGNADTVDSLHASSFVRSDTSDTMSGDLTIDNGTNTTVTVLSDDTGVSLIRLLGNSQGTGRLYVGQSGSYGGGVEYNGDNSPASTGAGADRITLYRVSAGTYNWTGRNHVNSNDWEFRGNLTAYSSDKRLKENIETIPNALDKVCKLRGVTFDWKDDCEDKGFMPTMKHETGVIAQEVQAVIPDAAVPAPFNEDYLTVKHEKITPVLIEAIKELKAEIDELKTQLVESG